MDGLSKLAKLGINLVALLLGAYGLGLAWLYAEWGSWAALAGLVAPLAIWLISVITARWVELQRIRAQVRAQELSTTPPQFGTKDADQIQHVE